MAHLDKAQIKAIQDACNAHFDDLTERACEGNFQAFRERQRLLSRDPVDLGMEWQQFQERENAK